MASVSRQRNGNWVVQFKKLDAARPRERGTVRIGKMSAKQAGAFRDRVEELFAARTSGCPWSIGLAEWVRDLPENLAQQLAGYGLMPPRQRLRLGPFIAQYIEGRHDVKPASKTVWRQGERSLIEYFGADCLAEHVTPVEAEAFKNRLLEGKLRPYTVRKRLQSAKMFFNAMKRRGAIKDNPFDGVTVAAVVDESRNVYVPRADAIKVMEACQDAEWRLILALCRFGGLRCPTEVLSLRWEHIDWKRERITVISPKTAHHPRGGQRQIPLFSELVQPLRDALAERLGGSVHVIARHRSQAESAAGWRNSNLRTALQRFIERAGLNPWPKPFHALRASFETDLIENKTPIQTAAKWLGHSPRVAVESYLRDMPHHDDQAARGDALHQALHQTTRTGAQELVRPAKSPGICTPDDSAQYYTYVQADGEGFEPPEDSRPQRFSRPPP